MRKLMVLMLSLACTTAYASTPLVEENSKKEQSKPATTTSVCDTKLSSNTPDNYVPILPDMNNLPSAESLGYSDKTNTSPTVNILAQGCFQ